MGVKISHTSLHCRRLACQFIESGMIWRTGFKMKRVVLCQNVKVRKQSYLLVIVGDRGPEAESCSLSRSVKGTLFRHDWVV